MLKTLAGLFCSLLIVALFVGCTEEPVNEPAKVDMSAAMGQLENEGPFHQLPAPPQPPLPDGVR